MTTIPARPVTNPHRAPHPGSGERGSVSLWVAVVAAGLLAMLAMVVDSGAKIRAGDRADTVAAEAARAAVIAAGPRTAAPRGPTVSASATAAAAAARAFIARAGLSGTVAVTGPRQVSVQVTAGVRGPISGRTYTMTRTATAELLIGLQTGERP